MPKYLRLVLFLILVFSILVISDKQQDIKDWWVVRSFDASEEIRDLADRSSMSKEGRRLFYASQPQLDTREDFNDNCPFPERSLILGCYSDQRIYIFNVDDQRIKSVEEITAAHEMLHAVYDRLDASERERIDELTEQAFQRSGDERLQEIIDLYIADDPNSAPNELHSILGTEIASVGDELEEHYSRFFEDRSIVVALSGQYQGVFDEIQQEIDNMDSAINQLKTSIKKLESQLQASSSFIEDESARLDGLLDLDKIAAYNAAVPAYNDEVASFNNLIEEYQGKVDQHNQLVQERNRIALEQNSIIQSLDSKFSPIVN